MRHDRVDRIVELWAAHEPALDVSSLHVAGRLLRTAALLERAREAALRPHQLSLGDYDVLATLSRAGRQGAHPKDLADGALITTGAMTSRLDRLHSAGLITRHPDPSDRRAVLVRLTERGQELAAQAVGDVLAAHNQFLEPLSQRDRDAAASVLRKLLTGRGDQ